MAPGATTAGAGPPPAPPRRAPRLAWRPVRPWPRLTPPPPRRPPTRQATTLAWLTRRMRWAQSMRLSRLAASHPVFPVRPTTTATRHGSSRPTARTASTTAWCPRPEVAHADAARAPHERQAQKFRTTDVVPPGRVLHPEVGTTG